MKYRHRVIEAKLKPEDIRKADEAFLTNSLVEIMPLVSLEHKPIAKGIPGKITERLLQRYRALVKN